MITLALIGVHFVEELGLFLKIRCYIRVLDLIFRKVDAKAIETRD